MPKTILLVAEDDAIDALLLERALRRTGSDFQMVRVANGDELIDYVEGRGAYGDRVQHPSPKVILLDLKMPQKDGFAVLRWRQTTPEGYRLPVVVFSSSALPQDINRAYSLGANSYVVKPTAPDRLECMVKALHDWWAGFNTTPAFNLA
ncbi:MAG: putative response regulator, CheY [Rariglobus sp.]|jgi:CheY-like chemotaxis protein|nr:putative response regulator, CheY [Rariglobus sp.]